MNFAIGETAAPHRSLLWIGFSGPDFVVFAPSNPHPEHSFLVAMGVNTAIMCAVSGFETISTAMNAQIYLCGWLCNDAVPADISSLLEKSRITCLAFHAAGESHMKRDRMTFRALFHFPYRGEELTPTMIGLGILTKKLVKTHLRSHTMLMDSNFSPYQHKLLYSYYLRGQQATLNNGFAYLKPKRCFCMHACR